MKKDQPSFTLRQVGIICERLLKDYEDKIREEYEQILNTKLADYATVWDKANKLHLFPKERAVMGMALQWASHTKIRKGQLWEQSEAMEAEPYPMITLYPAATGE
ncbi:hypothetical protein P7K49_016013 [Saguinus oedipus]|uniref:Uncharacterized protein n=1 Tax=Saguinus oedipus TaxID=9490 RepID=A0ABQ9VAU7_SAGOE|nr:hypothetical protein P7K49_016013 [Saguinus oedipus]